MLSAEIPVNSIIIIFLSSAASLTNWGLGKMADIFNTLRPRQNGHHFADDIFKCIFLNENVWITIKVLLKYIPTLFSLICAWKNGWVNNREASDLRRYRAHHDVIVMLFSG